MDSRGPFIARPCNALKPRLTFALNAISNILGVRALSQVARIHARWVMADMVQHKAVTYRTNHVFI